MLPTPDLNRLSLWNKHLLTINTDGTVPAQTERMTGPLVKTPAFMGQACGPVFVCPSRDGTFFYLSGIYGCEAKKGDPLRDGFWLDGQLWKVDLATRKAAPLFALDRQAVVGSLTTRMAKASESSLGGIQSYSALHGVADPGRNQPVMALFWFAIFAWSLVVDAHIYRNALSVTMAQGLLVAVLLMAASYVMIELLF